MSNQQSSLNIQNVPTEISNGIKRHLKYVKTFSFVMIIVNIFIYMLEVYLNTINREDWNTTLVNMGAKYTPYIRDNYHFHRLILPIFLHNNLMHLIWNCFNLALFAIFMEFTLSTKNTIISYFISGIISTTLSAVLNPGYISVGASGAIFGKY
jgi:rhomboid protease GluP